MHHNNAEKNEELKKIQKDILNGNWEKYIPFGDVLDFLNMYVNDEIFYHLLSDKHNVITLLNKYKMSGNMIEKCPYDIKSDKDVVYAAVLSTSSAMKIIPEKFLTDKTLALLAVSNDGLALEHCVYFQNDEQVVATACKENGEAIQFASDELKQHKELALIALQTHNKTKKYCCETYYYLSDKFKTDKDCMLTAIKHNQSDFYYGLSNELQNDPDLIEAMKKLTFS